ncbi:MAG TPA: helix-turn-helix domain-containing protein [Baekduia sp.]|nr:helix-turn-helix domain-containing protein [Baekduia sp.]
MAVPTPTRGGSTRTSAAERPRDAADTTRSDATRLLTAAEVAERWQVRTKQVYALVNRGELPCIRIGRYRRFRLEAIEAWECEQEAAPNVG